MNAIEEIFYKKKRIALIIRNEFTTKDNSFFSDEQDFFQLGFFYRKKGYSVPAHYHTPKNKIYVSELSECIQVKKGKIKISYFTHNLTLIASAILCAGDTVMHTDVVHEVEFLQNTLILELKQGPYDNNGKHFLRKRSL